MATVYAVIEYLPIGAAGAGAGGEHVHSEHPDFAEAAAAKQELCFRQPELVGCLTIRLQAPVLKDEGVGDADRPDSGVAETHPSDHRDGGRIGSGVPGGPADAPRAGAGGRRPSAGG